MDNPETQATLGTQYTNTNTMSNMHYQHKNLGVNTLMGYQFLSHKRINV